MPRTINDVLAEITGSLAELSPLGGVELPTPTPPPPVDTVIRVRAGDDLQAALNLAAASTEGRRVRVRLAPRAEFRGNFWYPAKSHGFDVHVETDWDPAENLGTGRVDPTNPDLPVLAPVVQSQPVIRAQGRVEGWVTHGLRVAATGPNYAQIALGSDTAADPLEVPGGLVFLQCVVHGDPVAGQKRGIMANCRKLIVQGCDFRHHGYVGADAQNICGWNGPGPFLIDGNYLEGYGENLMFGGATCRSEAMVPADIVIRGNHVTKDRAHWDALASKWTVKNLFEIKNAQRVLVEGNLFEHCWRHGQSGGAILLKAASNDQITPARCRDLIFRYNVARRAGDFLSLANREGTGLALGCDNIEILGNLAYELGTGVWTGSSQAGAAFRIGEGPANLRLLRNTVLNKHSLLTLWSDPLFHQLLGFEMAGNLLREGDYGIFGQGTALGRAALDAYAAGDYRWEQNVVEDSPARKITYPAGTTLLPAGALTSGALGPDYRPTDPALAGVGADIDAIQALFTSYGLPF